MTYRTDPGRVGLGGMTAASAYSSLRRRGYSQAQAELAIDRAQPVNGGGSYQLSRHRVQYITGEGFMISPVPWDDGASRIEDEQDPGSGQRVTEREILHIIETVDRHLDEAAPEIYRNNPLANRWRRIAAGPVSESVEASDALNLATGGNPRKGVIGDDAVILGELGDTTVAGLLAIQSITKDADATWLVFLEALDKAMSRVPEEKRS